MPHPLRPMLRALGHVRWALHPSLWILEGKERISGRPLRLAYAGSSEPYKNFVARLAFSPGHAEARAEKVFFASAGRIAARHACDLVFYEALPSRARLVRFPGKIRIPVSVAMELDLSPGEETVLGREKVKAIAKKTAKLGLTSEFVRDASTFKAFYETMYAPYVERRFDETAVVQPYERLSRWFAEKNCELLVVKKDGAAVAGSMVETESGRVKGVCLGVAGGREDLLKAGVVEAIYWFEIRRALERRASVYDLGFCKAFLSSGILKHKSYLGGALVPRRAEETGFWHLDASDSEGARAFLRANPFVRFGENETFSVRAHVWEGEDFFETESRELEKARGSLPLELVKLKPLKATPQTTESLVSSAASA